MQRAVLYARVSTDRQKEEGTVESQVAELQRQIAAAGHTLVKEYIDDGASGAYLDRPALDELRRDVKLDMFGVVYFPCADRIARDVMHQTIIVDEMLRHKKRIIINGKDYEENPENKFSLTVLGAVAEFERAKIRERMTRGTLHSWRLGKLTSHGHRIYGYDYVRKTPTQPCALVVNERQAEVVRFMFERFGSGELGLKALTRALEQRRIPTLRGLSRWDFTVVKRMLGNRTYAGVRYFNTMTDVRERSGDGRAVSTPRGRGTRAFRPLSLAEDCQTVTVRSLLIKLEN
jgi:site-specific DNA recombinase